MDTVALVAATGTAGVFAACVAPILHRLGRRIDRAARTEAKELASSHRS